MIYLTFTVVHDSIVSEVKEELIETYIEKCYKMSSNRS